MTTKEQPVGLSIQSIKNFAADPNVHDAVYNPVDTYSVAWQKREEEHRRALADARKHEQEAVDLTEQEKTEAVEVMLTAYRPHPQFGWAHREWMKDALNALLQSFDMRRKP